MSNAIRYDSLLLAALARSLDTALSGRSIRGIWLDRVERALIIRFAAAVRRGDDTFLHWHLNPSAGDLTVSTTPRSETGSTVQVAPGTSLNTVRTLPDERILCFELWSNGGAHGFARRIYVELIGTRWNAIAAGEGDVITALIQARERDGILLRPGSSYRPPAARARAGAEGALTFEMFADALRTSFAAPDGTGQPAEEDVRRVLVRAVAYTSPINATFICTPIVARLDDDTLALAFERYRTLRQSDAGFVLPDGRGQPYPGPLGLDGAALAGSLLDAFAIVAARAAGPVTEPVGDLETARAAVHERIRRTDERIAKLTSEHLGAATEAEQLRNAAGLLLAQLHAVARGAVHVTLDAFDGTTLDAELDPALSAKDNAAKWYDQARRRELAAERVPALLAKAARERDALAELAARLVDGTASADEISHWSREVTRARPGETPVVLPYRVYHTSGGLELRVGRNSRANDLLTFHHSAADDIWLHARDLAGAHVILRWGDRNAGPPARDLHEAATIAAVNSRGRTSGMVAVDWTRRKYVRKPRKAPPGRVLVERSKTIFVEPDAKLDRLLAADP